MRRRTRHPLVRVIVVVAIIVSVAFVARKHYWPATQPADTRPADTPNGESTSKPAIIPPPHVKVPVDVELTPENHAKATALLEQGMALYRDNKLLAARATLADALNTLALPAGQAEMVRTTLAELAGKTIFSPRPVEGDPCTSWYKFQRGDVLVKVERKLKLHVPTQLIQKINNIPDATKIQAGQTLKMIHGPFHAVVSKSRFVMDIFLEEPGTHRMIFVRRLRVGVGRDGSTPAGNWRVVHGGKITNAPWTPPASSNLERRRIEWGEPGYPFGPKGYWISLEGADKNTPHTREDGYGIHGTNDPSSVGKASSLGCIRLTDKDIETLFSMLYEKWSTVTIVP